MPEADLDVNKGRKRRLPTWMQETTATMEPKISEVINKEDEQPPQRKVPSFRKKGKDILSSKETIPELEIIKDHSRQYGTVEDPGTVPRVSRRTRLQGKESKGKDGGKRKRRTSPLEAEGTDLTGYTQEVQNLDPIKKSGDDVDLTVDDLLSIAKEYIDADVEKRKQETTATGMIVVDDSKTKCTKSSFTVPSKRSLDAYTGFTESVSIGRALVPCSSSLSETDGKKEYHEHESFIPETAMTGDVAQDMLNLFLGPLLQIPEPKQRKLDNVLASDTTKYPTSETTNKVEVPTEKKKSSLRDKVSLLLQC